MAALGRCYLLELPREIRNRIYDNLTTTRPISFEPDLETAFAAEPRPKLSLHNTITFDVMLVNCQIHDEYWEYCIPKSELIILVKEYSAITRDVGLVCSIRPNFLRRIRHCRTIMSWARVRDVPGAAKMVGWCVMHTVEEVRNQEAMPWTPSKAVRADIIRSLSDLQCMLSPEARVTIVVTMDASPMHGTGVVVGIDRIAVPIPGPVQNTLPYVFHRAMLSSLETDTTLTWPLPGRLRVMYQLRTTLFCIRAEYDDANKRAQTASLTADSEFTENIRAEKDRPMVSWYLRPTTDECNYNGFFPEYDGLEYELGGSG